MLTTPLRIKVTGPDGEYFDMSHVADRLLEQICDKSGIHPIAVITAALVLLKQREG